MLSLYVGRRCVILRRRHITNFPMCSCLGRRRSIAHKISSLSPPNSFPHATAFRPLKCPSVASVLTPSAESRITHQHYICLDQASPIIRPPKLFPQHPPRLASCANLFQHLVRLSGSNVTQHARCNRFANNSKPISGSLAAINTNSSQNGIALVISPDFFHANELLDNLATSHL